jgi:hypothetical protein
MENHQESEVQMTIEQLREQHQQAEQRLRELDRHVWLSPDEQVELARLKKRKLQLKDEIRHLASQDHSPKA